MEAEGEVIPTAHGNVADDVLLGIPWLLIVRAYVKVHGPEPLGPYQLLEGWGKWHGDGSPES